MKVASQGNWLRATAADADTFQNATMLKITRAKNGETVFKVSGRLDRENLDELKALFSSEANSRRVVLDLSELTLVDEDAVRSLKDREADGIELRKCPAYVREWITRERGS